MRFRRGRRGRSRRRSGRSRRISRKYYGSRRGYRF